MKIIVDEMPVRMDSQDKLFETNCVFEKCNGECILCNNLCYLLRPEKNCPFLKKGDK